MLELQLRAIPFLRCNGGNPEVVAQTLGKERPRLRLRVHDKNLLCRIRHLYDKREKRIHVGMRGIARYFFHARAHSDFFFKNGNGPSAFFKSAPEASRRLISNQKNRNVCGGVAGEYNYLYL